jgi:hypothetical protein
MLSKCVSRGLPRKTEPHLVISPREFNDELLEEEVRQGEAAVISKCRGHCRTGTKESEVAPVGAGVSQKCQVHKEPMTAGSTNRRHLDFRQNSRGRTEDNRGMTGTTF